MQLYPVAMETAASSLRRGWTTGACAAAAAKAAVQALLTGTFPDPVSITLPGGAVPAFALAVSEIASDWAMAGIVKDAGDDPDVTHGALVMAQVRRGEAGSGITYRAGPGVGTITKPGLPLPPGEPAINPTPRRMIAEAMGEVCTAHGVAFDMIVTISIEGGAELAKKTLNPRLGILGGLSVLGTTGIVVPYSCAAWIHSIHRGIDVARAVGLSHIAGATGSASEAAVAKRYGLPEEALIDMGDFVGGMLKYLRSHPVPRVTVAGGFAKMVKLAQGYSDLHSRAGAVDLPRLAGWLGEAGAPSGLVEEAKAANNAAHVLALTRAAGFPIGDLVAQKALIHAGHLLAGSAVQVDIAIFDREGVLVGQA
jgi:cobalt-precorrin-5B (C1)-methyltransferase